MPQSTWKGRLRRTQFHQNDPDPVNMEINECSRMPTSPPVKRKETEAGAAGKVKQGNSL